MNEELKAAFDKAEASLSAAKDADALLATADEALAHAQEEAGNAAENALAKHQAATADGTALVEAIKAHFGLV